MKRGNAIPGLKRRAVRAPSKGAAREPLLADLDTQLMLQLRAGRPDAANSLIRRNFERVSRYIGRLVRNTVAAEDLTQDVFLQVLKNAPQYEANARFSTWLYRIATNTALNYLNQAALKKRRNYEAATAEQELPDRGDGAPDRQISLREMRDRVSAAINNLPVRQRVALTLFQFEELSYDQIAAVLDTTVEAVRCLLERARETLRARLHGLA